MNDDTLHMKSTMVDVESDYALRGAGDSETETSGLRSGMSNRQLANNYEAILQSRAIYYPVAYRFDRELGRGRQGIVFLGRRHGARGCITRHAIKLFDPSIYPSAKKYWTDMGRIADQISQLQSINSPNLVSREIYEEVNGIGYIQMEAINGIDVQKFLDGDHLNTVRSDSAEAEWDRLTRAIFRFENRQISIQPGVALYIIRRVLRGLEPLHELGFLHSDIKPSNVMMDRLGNVRIVDFGRAVRINERVNYLFGSPLYMAPEVHRREPSNVRADLYSVGIVLLELLTGKPFVAYRGMTEQSLLNAKLTLPGKLASILPHYVSKNEQFMHILRKLIDPDPFRRFASAMEAESGPQGIQLVHKQLTLAGKDTEYDRELENYLSKILPSDHGGTL